MNASSTTLPAWGSVPTLPRSSTPLATPIAAKARFVPIETDEERAALGNELGLTPPPVKKKAEPTKGMKLFDGILYPFITNSAVFAISVYFTYQTTHGKPNSWLRRRGEATMDFLEKKLHLNHNTADMAKMVTFSFIDGSLMAPVVAGFENRSIPISQWLDKQLGTQPETEAPYKEKEQRKQTLGTILAGRAATVGVVVPTAVLFSQKWFSKEGERKAQSLNDVLFNNPGEEIGKWMNNRYPSLQKRWPNLHIPYLSKTMVFEFVYTGICTAGLYFGTRFLTGPMADYFKTRKAAKAKENAHAHALQPKVSPSTLTAAKFA